MKTILKVVKPKSNNKLEVGKLWHLYRSGWLLSAENRSKRPIPNPHILLSKAGMVSFQNLIYKMCHVGSYLNMLQDWTISRLREGESCLIFWNHKYSKLRVIVSGKPHYTEGPFRPTYWSLLSEEPSHRRELQGLAHLSSHGLTCGQVAEGRNPPA